MAVFYYCLTHGIPAERFELSNASHQFVVIGRKKGSDPKDPSTWGPDAMICDPWIAKQEETTPPGQARLNYYNVQKHGLGPLQGFFGEHIRVAAIEKFSTADLQPHRTVKRLRKEFLSHMQTGTRDSLSKLAELKGQIASDIGSEPEEVEPIKQLIARTEAQLKYAGMHREAIFDQCLQQANKEEKSASRKSRKPLATLDLYSAVRNHAQNQWNQLTKRVDDCFSRFKRYDEILAKIDRDIEEFEKKHTGKEKFTKDFEDTIKLFQAKTRESSIERLDAIKKPEAKEKLAKYYLKAIDEKFNELRKKNSTSGVYDFNRLKIIDMIKNNWLDWLASHNTYGRKSFLQQEFDPRMLSEYRQSRDQLLQKQIDIIKHFCHEYYESIMAAIENAKKSLNEGADNPTIRDVTRFLSAPSPEKSEQKSLDDKPKNFTL